MESRKYHILFFALFSLGLLSMATQIIVIREFLAAFQGNELIIGLILGSWMLLTGLGAFLISRFRIKSAISLAAIFQMLLGILPGLMFWLLAAAKNHYIPAGAAGGIREIMFILLIVLAPFCLISGMLFPLMARELSETLGKNLIARAYALDSTGSIAGGLIFSLFFIFILDNLQSLLILAGLGFISSLMLARLSHNRIIAALTILLGIIYANFLYYTRPDIQLDRLLFPGQEVLESRITPFGKLTVTRSIDQINLFENSVPIVTGENVVSREESVHYALALHPSPGQVLMISGGTGGTLGEVLKYPMAKLDYLEINPWLTRLALAYRLLETDDRISIIHQDPKIFLNRHDKEYDVILLNAPVPLSAELNRYFTVEFYRLLKSKLNEGGIVSLSIPAAGNYMNEASRALHSVTFHTLKKAFAYVRIIPGEKDYYLASDADISGSILTSLENKNISNLYVNPNYFHEELTNSRSKLILNDLNPNPVINKDLQPYSYSQSLRRWMSLIRFDGRIILFILVSLVILAFIFFGPLNLGLFVGGFTASSLEFLLLIWMQVVYGFIYQMTGVIFAVFMAGLATGSLYRQKIISKNTFSVFLGIQGTLAVFSATIAIIFLLFTSSPFPLFSTSPLPRFPASPPPCLFIPLILLLVLITGLLTGIQFSLSAHLRKSNLLKSSGEAFSADLIGSAIGIGLLSVYLVPQLGLPFTAAALALLNVVAVGIVYLKGK